MSDCASYPNAEIEPAQWTSEVAPPPRSIRMQGGEIDSREIFAAGRLVTITHGEHRYQLRLTAQNKLILTK